MAVKKLLQVFRQRLTNLSGNNRSLLLLRLYIGQHIDLQQFDFVLGKPAFDIIRQLVAGKSRIPLCQVADARDAANNRVSYLTKQLQRTAQTVLEEQGAENLCVGYPFVQGRLNNDTVVRCPLLFFPVRLATHNGKWLLTLREDVPIGFNKTFLLAYAHHNGQPLNQLLNDWTPENPAEDVITFLTGLYRLLESAKLELHFNAGQFEERLQPFTTFTRKELDAATATGQLKLVPEAVLGQFPQADSYLAPDYDVLLADEQAEDLEVFFNKANVRQAPREEEIVTPYEIDATQEKALRLIKSGQSLVVQGPPGTGKSQLIVNLIADAMASGKRVLVVCQKKAALDVVYQRLQEKELHHFAALVHDFQQDRARIYANIARQIQQVQEKHEQRIDVEMLQNEQQFLQIARRIVQAERELEDFRKALFDESTCGISAKNLYLTSSLKRPHVQMSESLSNYFNHENAQSFANLLQRYLSYARQTDAPTSLWRNRRSFAEKSIADLRPMQQVLEKVPAVVDICRHMLADNPLTQDFTQKTWTRVSRLPESLRQLQDTLEPRASCLQWEAYNTIAAQWLQRNRAQLPLNFAQVAAQVVAWAEELSNWQLAPQAVPEAKVLLQSYLHDHQNWTGAIKWFFSGKKKQLREWLTLHQLPLSVQGASDLLHKITCYEQLQAAKSALQGILPFLPYPDSLDVQQWKIFFTKTVEYRQILADWCDFVAEHLPDFDVVTSKWEALPRQWRQLAVAMQKITDWQQTWGQVLSEAQQDFLWAYPEEAAAMRTQLDALFEDLCAIDALKSELKSEEQEMIELLATEAPDRYEEWLPIFENSWRLAALVRLENLFPVLRKASGQALLQTADALRQAVVQKQALSLQIAQSRAWERAFSNLEYNRLQNLVSYRDLLHQVSKKRGVWPLRKLIASYWDELANLVPCWLASPESASALFPMQELFDLVIFDEASQCFAEKGIPAMYRGKQAVIVGDDKQLAPFDLYRPRWEEVNSEEEAAPELEVESLLDLGKRYLPQMMLTGHYRSRYPELIGFSNRHFYQQKLQTLPYRSDWQPQSSAIRFVKVEGIWEGKTNRIEAETVVQIISEQLVQYPDRSIGIITFNIHQQQLIMDLLEQSGLSLPASLFVKNIENVQGDERDCIVFSVGYAPSAAGRLQLNFGSLSQVKGENRLNVAVTRARERIIVVSSIFPQQLQVENVANNGPRLLRAYLEYAYAVSEQAPHVSAVVRGSEQLPDHSLASRLQSADSRLRSGQPFADLIATDENAVPTTMILTDDLPFYRAVSARSIFVYQPLHFNRKAWDYRYQFSRNWWKENG
ncbi:AAA domain-containing protein [Rhodoflexus sp.]